MSKKVGAIFFWNENREPDEYGDRTDEVNIDAENYHGDKVPGIPLKQYKHEEALLDYLHREFGFSIADLTGVNGSINRKLVNLRHVKLLAGRVEEFYHNKGWI